jgi:hypothetical protein
MATEHSKAPRWSLMEIYPLRCLLTSPFGALAKAEAEKRLSCDSALSAVGIHYKSATLSDPAATKTLISHVCRSVASFLLFSAYGPPRAARQDSPADCLGRPSHHFTAGKRDSFCPCGNKEDRHWTVPAGSVLDLR